MKTIIKRLLATLGLVPVSQLASALADARSAAERLKAAETRLHADIDTWRRRCEEKSNGAAELKQAAARADARAAEAEGRTAKADAERVRAVGQAEEWKKRAEKLAADVKELRATLEGATRSTTTAREQLMAIEVKLDLLEAAIHVLDRRTRQSAVGHSAEVAADRDAARV